MQLSTILTLALSLPVVLCAPQARGEKKGAQVVVLEAKVQGDIAPKDQVRLGDAVWPGLDRLGRPPGGGRDRGAVVSGAGAPRGCPVPAVGLGPLGRLPGASDRLGAALS